MKQLEQELGQLNSNLLEMWELVYNQLLRAREALMSMNADLAFEIITMERKVDAFELLIDQQCENIIALHSPVAIDLRFVLSCYKINTSLERIGDFAKSIAKMVINFSPKEFDKSLILETRSEQMFAEAVEMFEITKRAFQSQDAKITSKVFAKDFLLDEINRTAMIVLADLVKEHPEIAEQALNYSNIIRKIERIGDYCNNICEEIVFYLEAKVLKHKKLQKGEK